MKESKETGKEKRYMKKRVIKCKRKKLWFVSEGSPKVKWDWNYEVREMNDL